MKNNSINVIHILHQFQVSRLFNILLLPHIIGFFWSKLIRPLCPSCSTSLSRFDFLSFFRYWQTIQWNSSIFIDLIKILHSIPLHFDWFCEFFTVKCERENEIRSYYFMLSNQTVTEICRHAWRDNFIYFMCFPFEISLEGELKYAKWSVTISKQEEKRNSLWYGVANLAINENIFYQYEITQRANLQQIARTW